MKTVSLILQKKLNGLFGQPNTYNILQHFVFSSASMVADAYSSHLGEKSSLHLNHFIILYFSFCVETLIRISSSTYSLNISIMYFSKAIILFLEYIFLPTVFIHIALLVTHLFMNPKSVCNHPLEPPILYHFQSGYQFVDVPIK